MESSNSEIKRKVEFSACKLFYFILPKKKETVGLSCCKIIGGGVYLFWGVG